MTNHINMGFLVIRLSQAHLRNDAAQQSTRNSLGNTEVRSDEMLLISTFHRCPIDLG